MNAKQAQWVKVLLIALSAVVGSLQVAQVDGVLSEADMLNAGIAGITALLNGLIGAPKDAREPGERSRREDTEVGS